MRAPSPHGLVFVQETCVTCILSIFCSNARPPAPELKESVGIQNTQFQVLARSQFISSYNGKNSENTKSFLFGNIFRKATDKCLHSFQPLCELGSEDFFVKRSSWTLHSNPTVSICTRPHKSCCNVESSHAGNTVAKKFSSSINLNVAV